MNFATVIRIGRIWLQISSSFCLWRDSLLSFYRNRTFSTTYVIVIVIGASNCRRRAVRSISAPDRCLRRTPVASVNPQVEIRWPRTLLCGLEPRCLFNSFVILNHKPCRQTRPCGHSSRSSDRLIPSRLRCQLSRQSRHECIDRLMTLQRNSDAIARSVTDHRLQPLIAIDTLRQHTCSWPRGIAPAECLRGTVDLIIVLRRWEREKFANIRVEPRRRAGQQ